MILNVIVTELGETVLVAENGLVITYGPCTKSFFVTDSLEEYEDCVPAVKWFNNLADTIEFVES